MKRCGRSIAVLVYFLARASSVTGCVLGVVFLIKVSLGKPRLRMYDFAHQNICRREPVLSHIQLDWCHDHDWKFRQGMALPASRPRNLWEFQAGNMVI